MTNNQWTLWCLLDGESTPFPVEIESTKTIGALKKAIKDDNAVAFADVDAKMLTLWKVSVPVLPKKERKGISLVDVPSQELDETDDVSDAFKETLPKKTIHIIVQRPLPVRDRATTPLSNSDDSRPATPLSGDLKKFTENSLQTLEQDGAEVEMLSPDNLKLLQGAILVVPQVLPTTPVSDHSGDDAAESNSDEEADTKTETESEVHTQVQVQLRDQDQVNTSNLTVHERSKEHLVQEEGEKPSPDPESVIKQKPEISHGPLTTNRLGDDDKVDYVKGDSLIPDGQHIAQENNQNSGVVVKEEEVSNATLNDPTARCTQLKEPIKKGNFAQIDVGKEEEGEEGEDEEVGYEETTYCDVIGRTTGRPCGWLASECPHHRDSQGRVLKYCDVIGSTTGRPCNFLASQCPHHRDIKGRVLKYCGVIGRTTGRPCRWLASQCPHH
ncbi:hypothetical protein BGZ99_007246 [Dissophora globulifera]|uniref:Crinkler effector protein N-terminal domain-containing protein n=1 Tax=Dissophora globulifera TaxID=979702 RepID=A0A9P6RBA3_9FUNG|nr:hypothetical protein BGZ99_007246 [Dissophora globulifera]